MTFIFAILMSFAVQASINDKVASVVTEKVKKTESSELYSYPAKVVSVMNTTVLAENDGIVRNIFVSLGQKVKKGDRLISIQHSDPVYQYRPVVLRAPVSGVVHVIDASLGSQVSRGQKLLGVTAPDKNKILVEVPAQDAKLFSPGNTGVLEISGIEKPYDLVVKGVSPLVDPSTGTSTCELQETKFSGQLMAGQMGQVKFRLNKRLILTIPEDAVSYRGDQTLVRVVQGNKAKYVSVILGRSSEGNVEVKQGILEGDVIIKKSSQHLADGDDVEIQKTGGS